tara:strand:+ start:17473 stop:18219 length:747 start_codon:yes stop_codon:yes gene_type:complete
MTKESYQNSENCLDNYFDMIVCICIPERKKHMQKTFKKWGIKTVRFFDAFLKKDYTHADFIKMGFLTENYSDYLNIGRICCHYSATNVYKEFLNSKAQSILIFEDDLNKSTFRNVNDLNTYLGPVLAGIPNDWEYLNFSKCHDFCKKNKPVNKFWSIPNRPLCRTAIALKKRAASIIVAETSPMTAAPGDRMIGNLIKDRRFKAYSTTNIVFRQHREKFGSNLGNNAPTNPQMCARESTYSFGGIPFW